MTLAAFQQAQGDLVRSPAMCTAVRAGDRPSPLDPYDLTPRERARLEAVAAAPLAATACTLYRANRLTPLVLNLPRTCAALEPALREVADRWWAASPRTDVHFLLEADRFRAFLEAELGAGRVPADVAGRVRAELAVEGPALSARIAAEG